MKKTKTHGLSTTRLYSIWDTMKKRCDKSYHQSYEWYGGRGIKVCDEWHDDVAAFTKWAMKNGYADDLQIDRIDNALGYSPANCRWVSAQVNMRNRSSVVKITAFGETKLLLDWLDDPRCRTNYETLRKRIKHGWDTEKALTTPTQKHPGLSAFGETKLLLDWLHDPRCRTGCDTLYSRLSRGWDAEKALTTPPPPHPELSAFGETKLLRDWPHDPRFKAGTYDTLYGRITRGWDAELALTTPPAP